MPAIPACGSQALELEIGEVEYAMFCRAREVVDKCPPEADKASLPQFARAAFGKLLTTSRTSDQSFCANPCPEFTVELDCVPMFFVHVIAGRTCSYHRVIEGQVGSHFKFAVAWNSSMARARIFYQPPETRRLRRTACSRLQPVCQGNTGARFRIHQEIREISMPARWLMATRSCFMESRSRTVTVSRSAASFSPSVSKSTVTPNGVPISSWRR